MSHQQPQQTPAQQALAALDRILGSAMRRAYDDTERALIGGPAGQLIEQIAAALGAGESKQADATPTPAPNPAAPKAQRLRK